jgi:hypothetical protein
LTQLKDLMGPKHSLLSDNPVGALTRAMLPSGKLIMQADFSRKWLTFATGVRLPTLVGLVFVR